ncbi:unnamed protein product [Paramecium octaurelia]|uniref:Uncharacterized protein n=1 Tax=Paramecium octaurelia TaxID=43137 RepID=A0A8S1WQY8_PAROT|nr:unnamed protein product [Paramecium octaurelia]
MSCIIHCCLSYVSYCTIVSRGVLSLLIKISVDLSYNLKLGNMTSFIFNYHLI